MKKKRINDSVLASIPVQNGQVLKGEHLATLREVLSAAINENKYDIDRILAGQDAVHVYGNDVEDLRDYISKNPVAFDTLGYLYTENQIILYIYLETTEDWHELGVLNLTEFFYKVRELEAAKDYTYSQTEIDNKDTAIMNKANSLENANMFKDVSYNTYNGVFTFTRYDGSREYVDLPIELVTQPRRLTSPDSTVWELQESIDNEGVVTSTWVPVE